MSSLSKERVDKFRKVICGIIDKDVYVVASHIDPDSIGGVFGMSEILTSCGCRNVKIAYCGKVAHPQNREIFRQFNLQDSFLEAANVNCEINKDNTVMVLVDSSTRGELRLTNCFADISPTIVIDHHVSTNLLNESENDFFWIDSDMGSASTLIYELGRNLRVSFSQDARAMLAMGIHNDTDLMVNATQRDVHAFSLLNGDDIRPILHILIHFELPQQFWRMLRRVARNATDKKGIVVGGVGFVDAENCDLMAIVADRLIERRPSGTVVIVWGIVNEGSSEGMANINLKIIARLKGGNDREEGLSEFLEKRFGSHNAGAKRMRDGMWKGGAVVKFKAPSYFCKKETYQIKLVKLIRLVCEKSFLRLVQFYLERKIIKE